MNKLVNDHAYMAQALRLAEKGLYTTRTNPRVGCIIVKHDQVIGHGFHVSPGKPHAEINAIENCKGDTQDAIAYVTLEPCSHYGKTPPCIESLVAAKLRRVVAAMQDPNPQVDGKGLEYLREHNIETTCNILKNEATELNKGFVQRMTKARPYVTVKSAMSIDGRTALQSGESKWISSEQSRKDVQKLRARSCAIMTGIDTVIQDDPQLNVRLKKEELGSNNDIEQPIRVVLDTKLRISPKAKIINIPGQTIIFTCCKDSRKQQTLVDKNVEIVVVSIQDGHVDFKDVMSNLSERGVNEVLVEAGPTLIGNLIENELVDEMIIYMAPHIMGDSSKGLVKLEPILDMQERINMQIIQTRKIGNDIKLQLKVQY